MKSHRKPLSKERALQISNNVSEEYVDLGDTSFATKQELCETIIWLRDEYEKELRRKDSALDEIAILALKGRLYNSA